MQTIIKKLMPMQLCALLSCFAMGTIEAAQKVKTPKRVARRQYLEQAQQFLQVQFTAKEQEFMLRFGLGLTTIKEKRAPAMYFERQRSIRRLSPWAKFVAQRVIGIIWQVADQEKQSIVCVSELRKKIIDFKTACEKEKSFIVDAQSLELFDVLVSGKDDKDPILYPLINGAKIFLKEHRDITVDHNRNFCNLFELPPRPLRPEQQQEAKQKHAEAMIQRMGLHSINNVPVAISMPVEEIALSSEIVNNTNTRPEEIIPDDQVHDIRKVQDDHPAVGAAEASQNSQPANQLSISKFAYPSLAAIAVIGSFIWQVLCLYKHLVVHGKISDPYMPLMNWQFMKYV